MIRALIICPDEQLSADLEAMLKATEAVEICRVFRSYPEPADLLRVIRVHAPEAVFLSFENAAAARSAITHIGKLALGVQIVGVHRNFDAAILRETMRCGVREFFMPPFEPEAAAQAIGRIAALLRRNPVRYESTNHVFAFLPAKPGVGASTLALNISAALAARTHLLLSDFDLNSGSIRFSLNLPHHHSVVEAIQHAPHMDEKLWTQLVISRGNLDVLHAGVINPSLRIDPESLYNLVGFLRRSYPALVFDLSGNLERYSLEIMQESRQVFLVCTAEYVSLHLAREKMLYLRKHNLGERVQIILNRVVKRPLLSASQVEEVLGMPVSASFPNDYRAVTRALAAGKPVEASTELGKQIARFSETLLDRKPESSREAPAKDLLDWFPMPGKAPAH